MTSSVADARDKVVDVHFRDDTMSVDLADGRTITVLLTMYPTLLHASESQRKRPS
ncbi:MAG TPA: DUF2442 domain-containing protein [Candidatus Binatia bacterium]|nr:DUF2442 domain-containing protein [Candidatus Binatia bacterium]